MVLEKINEIKQAFKQKIGIWINTPLLEIVMHTSLFL
jgi:hypothetical protein